jgi:DNA-directed RNA polymerase subunit omega
MRFLPPDQRCFACASPIPRNDSLKVMIADHDPPENFLDFRVAFRRMPRKVCGSINLNWRRMNSEFCRQALAKVGNPNVLVNLISRRVRQLNSGGGSLSRPLIADTAGLGVADIALREIIEDKISFDLPEELQLVETPKRRKRR